MIPRGVLDIDWRTVLNAAARRYPADGTEDVVLSIRSLWETSQSVIVCQSVRSGFDLLLESQEWPRGSQILMSAATILQMAQVVAEHGYVPIPIDVDRETLSPDLDQLRARITPQTRAILVAHLFGSRLDLSNLAAITREHSLLLWEDVAQGFAADRFPGNHMVDASLFSFGMIKAQTALGGAILVIRDPEVACRCETVQTQWPDQPHDHFRQRVMKAFLLHFLTWHPVYSLLIGTAARLGIDYDNWLSRSVRGFDASQLFVQLRRRPCRAMLDLLHERLSHPSRAWLEQKSKLGHMYDQHLPLDVRIGSKASFPSRWVLPIVSRDPVRLQRRLVSRGFDATRRASQMSVIPAPVDHPEWSAARTQAWLGNLLFLPMHPALRPSHIIAIAETIRDIES